ncbi:ATPase involved in DNA replication initiation [Zymomonas mobilis subsp. mobilis ZM4 = ATCC 31821]|uniref:ATPase involved in DNA replication initiation n=2 Tax=Zymomonas mobilis subsp. mobilis TaxID=120045 RepID=Q5NPM5_ZYMMO|nr:chromosomal replication initiator protein DnaA [Zymomonas mobilis]AAV89335.1 ATPase involved in DNA replication initiation [Zymomonas mobilis subsp. mobilis ZM4 = ATCC 31821]ACV75109.1 chromosomal replication initiator, DnaA [Zymomonas mobilis subsp. mobilis NCIMB 11163]AEH62419.1 chromosomal replication initiator, DnaA [Zymomonas mobilis subsp. mobilis ATCC 10988]AHB09897.1 hypothetical protein ZCP4_0585 [Zymomonas mobilis subsp. mobilis str. CP4 = NRRL B-14023]AHJ70202.1 hypothetical prot
MTSSPPVTQMALPLIWPEPENDGDFIVSDANNIAVEQLRLWQKWPVKSALLTGMRKSGRSLLGRLFVARTGGELIDNAERRSEEFIFHAWNRAERLKRPLLVIADQPPPLWKIRLPDLRSRMIASPHLVIKAPDDSLIAALIERRLGRRGLPVSTEILEWVTPRIEHNYIAVLDWIDKLDQAALKRRGPITLNMVRAIMAGEEIPDEERRGRKI